MPHADDLVAALLAAVALMCVASLNWLLWGNRLIWNHVVAATVAVCIILAGPFPTEVFSLSAPAVKVETDDRVDLLPNRMPHKQLETSDDALFLGTETAKDQEPPQQPPPAQTSPHSMSSPPASPPPPDGSLDAANAMEERLSWLARKSRTDREQALRELEAGQKEDIGFGGPSQPWQLEVAT